MSEVIQVNGAPDSSMAASTSLLGFASFVSVFHCGWWFTRDQLHTEEEVPLNSADVVSNAFVLRE